MAREVKIGNKWIGDGHPTYIVAEIGINHNGDIGIAKELIQVGKRANVDAVKFQKRTPELCVPPDQRRQLRLAEDRRDRRGPGGVSSSADTGGRSPHGGVRQLDVRRHSGRPSARLTLSGAALRDLGQWGRAAARSTDVSAARSPAAS